MFQNNFFIMKSDVWSDISLRGGVEVEVKDVLLFGTHPS